MENAPLIGLSRQIALQRELDVVANNIANLNTTGFKADGSVFREHLMPVAREPLPRRRPQPQLRAGPRHLARFPARARRSRPATRSTSRSTATASWWCRRRAASATRATARCRSTPPASSSPASGDPVLGDGGPIVFQPRPQRLDQPTDGTITVREGVHHRPGARQAAPRPASTSRRRLQKDGASLFRAPGGRRTPQPRRKRRASSRARSRSRTCAASSR